MITSPVVNALEGEATAWLSSVVDACATSGPRLTAQRAAILHWVASMSGPFTTESVVAAVCPPSGIGRATVYRTLDWLRSDGWVTRTQGPAWEHAYVRQLPGQHHRALCSQCGCSITLNITQLDALLASLLAGLDFEPRAHLFEIYGVCGQCRTHL